LLGDREFVLEGGSFFRVRLVRKPVSTFRDARVSRPARGPVACSRGAQAQSRGGSSHFVVEARPPLWRKPACRASALDAAM